MLNLTLSNLSGFFAISFITISYFTYQKSFYFFYQSICIVFLSLSYFFSGNYFAMAGLALALVRTVVFYFYEKLKKVVPIYFCLTFSLLTCACYFLINIKLLKTAKLLDLLFLIALILIIFIYRCKKTERLRLLLIIPTTLNVLYNIFDGSPLFSTLTYLFEFFANLLAILNYQALPLLKKSLVKSKKSQRK